MFTSNIIRYILLLLVITDLIDSLIITSVNAGRKKFKTISFDYLLPPLVFEKDNKLGLAFHGHYKFRRPTFKWDFSLPLELPVEIERPEIPQPEPEPAPVLQSLNDQQANYNQQIYHHTQYNPQHYATELHPQHELHLIEHLPNQLQINEHHSRFHIMPHYVSSSQNLINDQKQHQLFEKSFLKPEMLSIHHQKVAPYRGKAQVSSFIENGHLVTAHHAMEHLHEKPKKIEMIDEAFEDQLDGPFGKNAESQNIKRVSTVRLGYGKTQPKDYLVSAHAYHPDSVPLHIANSLQDMSKYYTSLTFTNHLPDTPAYNSYQNRDDRWRMFGNMKRKFKQFKALLPVVKF